MINVYKTYLDAPTYIDGAGVFIDVLRATTSMAVALENGAFQILATEDIATALDMRRHPNERVLLCGERNMQRIEGFDLGNSPLEYTAERVAGKELVMTTTNGTRAALAAINSTRGSYGASFANFDAVLELLHKIMTSSFNPVRNVHIICAGTEGGFAEEDFLLAGMLVRGLGEDQPMNEAAAEAADYGRDEEERRRIYLNSPHCKRLIAAGFSADVEFCMQLNTVHSVPRQMIPCGLSPETTFKPDVSCIIS